MPIANFVTSTLTLAEDNVLRSPSSSRKPFEQGTLLDPDSVALHKAAGGFNCVIEVAQRPCRRMVSEQVSGVYYLPADARSLEQFVVANSTNLHSTALKRLAAQPGLAQTRRLVLSVDLVDLVFDSPRKLVLTYRLAFSLDRAAASDPQIVLSLPVRAVLRAPSSSPPTTSVSSTITVPHVHIDPEDLSLAGVLGEFDVVATCVYDYELDDATKMISIVAELGSSTLSLLNFTLDAQLLFDRFIGNVGLGQYLRTGSVLLTPVLALQGRDPLGATMDLWTDFEVSLFHIGKSPGQALVVAFDLMPGCHGIQEEVQRFIGDSDYGVISDEFVIETICKHKWNVGAFYRQLNLTQSLRFSDQNRIVDGTLHGVLSLVSLDVVTIETDSNSETDYIRLAGTATLSVTSLVADDGSAVDPSNIDLGPERQIPWALRTRPTLTYDTSPSAELRDFQQAAHRDVYRYFGRPFASCSPSDEAPECGLCADRGNH